MFLLRRRGSCLVALLISIISRPVVAAVDVQRQIEQYLQACVAVEQFMGAVLVVSDDQELVARGFGFADLEHQAPNTAKTKFRLGSITKQFTAMAIMILAEQGKLAVDDPVRKHLDETPDAWNDVTIHHLLSHTSGIPNFTGFPDYAKTMTLATTPSQLMARFKDKPLEFVPGEKFAYSNSGYVVLGTIIEKASGRSYEEFLQEAIFDPLGMRDTGYDHAGAILPERAAGYDQHDGKLTNAPFIDMSVPFAAGGLYSTIEDLRRWDQALQAGRLVSAESLAKMRSPVKDDFGYGWKMETRCSHTLVSHGGGVNGFVTYMIHIPQTQGLVVVLSNVMSDRPSRMAYDLVSILLEQPYELPRVRKTVKLHPSAYDGLLGIYRLSPTLQITVTRDGDHLYSSVSETNKDELFAESETQFFYKAVVAQITFIRDRKGRASRLILHQGGSDTIGVRVESAAEEAPRSFFGTKISPLCDEVRKREQLGEVGGVLVEKVFPDTTAAEAGLIPGDIVLSINGSPVADVAGFLVQVSMIQVGATVDVEIIRAREKMVRRGTMRERASTNAGIGR